MKSKFILAAIGAAMLFAGQAFAFTTTGNMTVSLNNIGSATVNTTAIAFGDVLTTTGAPTATGSITVNATSTMPYSISIDGGLHSGVSGACRTMATGLASRRYSTYTDAGFTRAWGDSDTLATCGAATFDAGGGASLAGTGSGSNQVLTVYAKAFGGANIGAMSDILTVTVIY
ncbi:MAG: spore coat protein U domain-containing protein [Mariprofundus sp.]|nr:spore coat protein U domain-containing protein [Mariprofundus sp.]